MIASLHQGIGDITPMRLAFYENWLKPPGLGQGKFGLAQLHAVLSFLRLEGRPTYDQIMIRSGRYSADWAYAELSSVGRAIVRRLPGSLRARWVLGLSRRLVKQTFRGSQARVRVRNGVGTMDIRGSIFCAVRETAAFPMCAFYCAAVERFLQCFDLDASVQIRQCKAAGADGCTMAVMIRGEHLQQPAAEAA